MHLSEKDNKTLSPIISKLSKKYVNGDIFPPHISVNFSAQINISEAKRVAGKSIKGIHKFEVETHSTQYSSQWHKTLFIQLKENPFLTTISKRLDKTFMENRMPYILDPHISLLYKDGLSIQEKNELAKSLKVPNKFLVSGIAVVTSTNPNYPKDYGAWKIVFEKELK